MSLLWRDRLLVSLEPDAVALARVGGGLRPRLITKRTVDCDPAFGVESWQGAVAALGPALETLRGERLKATVVLSNHFVRYAIVPFDAAVSGPEEELALARFHFAKVHGERAHGWDVRMSEERPGAPRLASAVDAGLLDAIRARFPRNGTLRLGSVQPYLMSACNLWRASMKEDAWLLLVEPQRACMALWSGREWRAVHGVRGEFATAEDWAALLDREQLRADAGAASAVLVHAPRSSQERRDAALGRQFLSLAHPALDGFQPEDGRLAMALTAR